MKMNRSWSEGGTIEKMDYLAFSSAHLSCPACHQPLMEDRCTSCSHIFPQTMGILDLRWPPPPPADDTERNLLSLILENYEQSTFNNLMKLWIDQAAQDNDVPDDILAVVQDYHASLQERGHHMIQMFYQQLVQRYTLAGHHMALDIGCGVGASSIALARRFETVIGLDPYLPSLLMARKFLQEQNMSNVVLVQAYAQSMPLPAHCIDYAVAQNVIEHLFEVEPVFHELQRVLQPGGCFCGDSRNRFDLFLPEPHAKLRWVGLWPRRFQPWYVWRYRRVAYESTYLLSLRELRRFARAAFGSSVQVVFPLNAAYGRSPRWDQIVQFIGRIPLLRTLFLAIYPSHLLIAQSRPG